MDAPEPKLNRFSLPALVATCVMCFPVGGVLGLLALFEIRRSKGREGGLVFALISVFVSLVMVPAIVISALTAGPPKLVDRCFYTQEEAVGLLRIVSYLEERFHEENGRYGALDEIGFKPQVGTGPYEITVEKVAADRFLAVAKGVGHMDGDLLTVDENKRVMRTRDLCAIMRQ